MAEDTTTLLLEEVQLIFRNFQGKETQYNREGDRNFAVIIPNEVTAQQMLKDGWAVKYLEPREEGDEPKPYMSVNVNYKGRPPRIVMLTTRARTNVDEEMIDTLDWANIQKADLIVRPYNWVIGEKSGVKAYLQSLFVTIEEDYLEQKYSVNVSGED